MLHEGNAMHWSSLEWFNLVLFIITGHAIPANELYKPVSHPILTIYIYTLTYIWRQIFVNAIARRRIIFHIQQQIRLQCLIFCISCMRFYFWNECRESKLMGGGLLIGPCMIKKENFERGSGRQAPLPLKQKGE